MNHQTFHPRPLARRLFLRIAAHLTTRRATPPPPETPHRLLLIRPDHLGDMLFLTPVLPLLREALPNTHITALVGPWAAPLLADHPALDAVETLAFPWFDRQPRTSWLEPYIRLVRAARTLAGRFDTAVILRFDHWWGGWLAAQAAIPRRIGYATPLLTPFLTEAVPYVPGTHEVVQNARLLNRLGVPATLTPQTHALTFPVKETAHSRASQLPLPPGTGPLVALHPGSGAPVKRWRPAKWGALADALHARYGARFVLTGGPAERDLTAAVAAHIHAPLVNLAGQTDLPTLAALFTRCALVIGPDSGPLHIAVAMGTPTVHLYGPVSPATFGPWGPPERHRVITRSLACQYCHRLDWPEDLLADHPCVHGIPVEPVLAAAEALLAAST
nr:glycosyltransferase family 9 protein [Ardenticatena sp.]